MSHLIRSASFQRRHRKSAPCLPLQRDENPTSIDNHDLRYHVRSDRTRLLNSDAAQNFSLHPWHKEKRIPLAYLQTSPLSFTRGETKLIGRSYVTAPCGLDISPDIRTRSGEPRPQDATCTSQTREIGRKSPSAVLPFANREKFSSSSVTRVESTATKTSLAKCNLGQKGARPRRLFFFFSSRLRRSN